jgi:hypothetical protein
MFGGGLLGGLLGLAVGEDTEAERRQREDTPEIHGQRQDRERQLRHIALREKLTEATRNETASAATPIQLDRDEMVDIRRRVDEEMPLELAPPRYLELTEDAQITPDGEISDLTAAPPAAAAAEEAVPPTAAASPPAPAAAATQPVAQPQVEPAQTEAPESTAVEEESPGTAGARGGPSLLRTGAAALAGGVIGARLADRDGDREPDHDDEMNPQDEEAARRIFAAASEVDIDVLSRRLWSRLRRELRTELLVDRERAGSLADIR